MKKTYTIGRDKGCDIIIVDDKDYVSRRHAILTVTTFGKMTIEDHSTNGTYVNGIKITPGEPFPVTRKDVVTLAHIYQLDWSKVPSSNLGLKIAAAIIAALIVIAAIIFGFKKCNTNPNPDVESVTIVDDSVAIKAREKAIADSIEAVRKDSIEKAKNDSTIKAQQKEIERLKRQGKAQGRKETEKAKPADEPKKKEPEKPAAKPIG